MTNTDGQSYCDVGAVDSSSVKDGSLDNVVYVEMPDDNNYFWYSDSV